MKIALTLKHLEGADPAVAVLLACVLFALGVVLFVVCRPPVLLWLMLMIGSAVATKWALVNTIGIVFKYPMLVGLAAISLGLRGRYRISGLGKFYLLYCGVILIQVFNPLASRFAVSTSWDGFIKAGSYLLAFIGIYLLVQKLVSRPEFCRQILPWFALWAVIAIVIQFPFWSFRNQRLTGFYDTPGTLQHTLARCLVILLIFALSRSGRWVIPAIGGTLVGAFMLLLTGGRTAIGSVLLALPFILRLRRSRAVIMLAITGGLAIAVLPDLVWKVEGFKHTYAHLVSRESTRFTWWPRTWGEILKSPIVGYGTNTSEIFAMMSWHTSTHNSYLDLAFDYGLPFAVLFIIMMLVAIWRCWIQIGRLPPGPQRELTVLAGAFLVMLCLEGAFLSDLVRINLKWFLVCVCFGILDGVSVWQKATVMRPAALPVGSLQPYSYVQAWLPPRA